MSKSTTVKAALAVVSAAAAILCFGTTTADAAAAYGPYLTVASPALNERSAPSTSASVVGSLAYHSTIYVACQTSGSLVGRSTVWDKLTNGEYISDYWTSTPGRSPCVEWRVSGRVVRCSAPLAR